MGLSSVQRRSHHALSKCAPTPLSIRSLMTDTGRHHIACGIKQCGRTLAGRDGVSGKFGTLRPPFL